MTDGAGGADGNGGNLLIGIGGGAGAGAGEPTGVPGSPAVVSLFNQ
jgi:hypothetical protein